MDSQVIELLGRNRLVDELLLAGLEVAIPARDRGIDLIAYADLGTGLDRFVARPIQMKASSGRGFSVDDLAAELGLSRRQLERRLKAASGQTPAELIRRLRLERAAQLLQAGTPTVAEVAYAVGYRSPSHFTAAFREHFGHVPTEHADRAAETGPA